MGALFTSSLGFHSFFLPFTSVFCFFSLSLRLSLSLFGPSGPGCESTKQQSVKRNAFSLNEARHSVNSVKGPSSFSEPPDSEDLVFQCSSPSQILAPTDKIASYSQNGVLQLTPPPSHNCMIQGKRCPLFSWVVFGDCPLFTLAATRL